jgi:hypothetical protein
LELISMVSRMISGTVSLAVSVFLVLFADAQCAAQTSQYRLYQPQNEGRSRTQSDDPMVLVVTGVIGPGSYRQFRSAVQRADPDLIILDGPGGILGEALAIGQEVRRRGINTLVGANGSCASACALVFLSGRTKYVGRNASVGLHAASDLRGRVSAEATDMMSDYLRSVGVPSSVVRRMAATAPSEIRWLTRSEQRALGFRAYPGG